MVQGSLVRLFKIGIDYDCEKVDAVSYLKEGIIFIKGNKVAREVNKSAARAARVSYGMTNAEWSKSFHKSWDYVREADEMDLVFDQIMHYFSTYGRESVGLDAKPYLPVEEVKSDLAALPNFKAFTIIRLVTEDEAKDYANEYFKTMKAPNSILMSALKVLLEFAEPNVDEIASAELRIARHDQLGTVPTKGDEFIRFLVYKATGSTLVVKNAEVIDMIRRRAEVDDFEKYLEKADLIELAKVFYRFKPIFLALRANDDCRPYVNRIRRMANRHHQPLSDINVMNVTKLMKENRIKDMEKVLRNCSLRDLVKVMNAIMLNESEGSVIYNVRNGKRWVAEKSLQHISAECKDRVANIVVSRLMGRLRGKKFYIPSYISYAVPTSEKQFIGNIPYGSSVELLSGRNEIAIYWENYKEKRTDLDIHLIGTDTCYGWNTAWRNKEDGILFSGDMTDATNGAVEAMYIEPNDRTFVVSVSNFTAEGGVPFKFLITNKFHNGDAVVTIEDAAFPPIPLKFDDDATHTQTVGLINDGKFIFYGGKSTGITPNVEQNRQILSAVGRRYANCLNLRKFIEICNGEVLDETVLGFLSDEERAEVIDLSPEAINIQTLMQIVDGDI